MAVHSSATTTPLQWDERTRKAMLVTGILFILTFVTSIPALPLYGPILDHKDYVLTAGQDTRVTFGILLEISLVVVNAGTAIALYPVARRFSESIAIGYVASRVFESTVIGLGLISLFAVLTLRQDIGGMNAADPAAVAAAAASLIAFHDATFLIGPAFCSGFGNGILLGYIMFKSGLMPRRLAVIGLVGGPMALGTAVAVLFGAYEQMSLPSLLFTGPEIVWEAVFGIYLTVRALRLGRERRTSSPAKYDFDAASLSGSSGS